MWLLVGEPWEPVAFRSLACVLRVPTPLEHYQCFSPDYRARPRGLGKGWGRNYWGKGREEREEVWLPLRAILKLAAEGQGHDDSQPFWGQGHRAASQPSLFPETSRWHHPTATVSNGRPETGRRLVRAEGESPQGPGPVPGAPGGRREQRPADEISSELKGGKGLAAAPGGAGAQSRVLGAGGEGSSRQPRLNQLISLPSLQGKAAHYLTLLLRSAPWDSAQGEGVGELSGCPCL